MNKLADIASGYHLWTITEVCYELSLAFLYNYELAMQNWGCIPKHFIELLGFIYMEDIKIGRKERARKKKVEGKEDKHKG